MITAPFERASKCGLEMAFGESKLIFLFEFICRLSFIRGNMKF
jgi:hypothetical protein